MSDNNSKKLKNGLQSDDVNSNQNAKKGKKLNLGTQKVDDLNHGTRMIDGKFGLEYEKMVNKIFKDKLLQVSNGYFKTNIKLQSIHDFNSMFSNWKLIQKTEKSKDDYVSKKSNQSNNENENEELKVPMNPFL